MIKMIVRKPVIAFAVLGFAAVLSGCLISGTKVFTLGLEDIPVSASGTFTRTAVDLTENDTFNDHKDEIRLIDRFGFICDIVNPTAGTVNVSVYFSTDPNLTDNQVATQATPLFRNFAVSANSTRHISYDESLTLLENFGALQEVLATGQLTFYSTSTSGAFNLLIDNPVLVITFTVGL